MVGEAGMEVGRERKQKKGLKVGEAGREVRDGEARGGVGEDGGCAVQCVRGREGGK